MPQTKRIYEVDVLRIICILTLLIDHTLAPYAGFWPQIEGITVDSMSSVYFWVGRICYSFLLPMWVFLSGYLNGYQVFGLQRSVSFRTVFWKKAQRLLIPCYFWGGIYLILSNQLANLLTIRGVFAFLSGEQHLWFLPMLFWVFIFSSLLQRNKMRDEAKLIILMILSIVAWNIQSLGIGNALHYLFYFELGSIFYKHRKELYSIPNIYIVVLLASFIFMCPLLIIWNQAAMPSEVLSLSERFTSQILMHITMMPLSILAIVIFYCFSLKHGTVFNKNWIVSIVSYSFGIYIFHQFILMYIYYETEIFKPLGNIGLPVLGFTISFALSVFFTYLFRKSQLGKKLVS